jgi:hypothetical protein
MNITRGTELFGVEVVRQRDALREASPISVTPGRLADRSRRAVSSIMANRGSRRPGLSRPFRANAVPVWWWPPRLRVGWHPWARDGGSRGSAAGAGRAPGPLSEGFGER